MNKVPKIICIVISVIFFIFTALQYNDPDYLLWMGVYGIAAVLSLAVAFNKVSSSVVIAAMIAYLIGAVSLWPPDYSGFSVSAGGFEFQEQVGEAAGLFICFIATVYFLVVVIKKRSSKNK